MKKLLILSIVALVLSGCSIERRQNRHCKLCPTKNEIINKDSLATHLKDSLYKSLYRLISDKTRDSISMLPGDTALFMAYLSCGEQNQILIDSIRSYNTSGMNSDISLRDNTIYLRANTDSLAVYHKIRERIQRDSTNYIQTHQNDSISSQNNSETKTITIKEYRTAWYIWVVGTFFIVIAFAVGYFVRKIGNFY
jgi:hypothetical protein